MAVTAEPLKPSDVPVHWLAMPIEEIDTLRNHAHHALHEDWDKGPIRAFLHLMTLVLFMQMLAVRDVMEAGEIAPATAERLARSDFASGYLFGLAANYVDACDLPQQSADAQMAITHIHGFAFGPEQGQRIIAEQSARQPGTFSRDFEEGMVAAHRDVNAAKRWLMTAGQEPPSFGLVEGFRNRD